MSRTGLCAMLACICFAVCTVLLFSSLLSSSSARIDLHDDAPAPAIFTPEPLSTKEETGDPLQLGDDLKKGPTEHPRTEGTEAIGKNAPAIDGYLSGRIKDDAGKPLKAVLEATCKGQKYTAHSEENGEFHISGLPRGRNITLRVRCDGYINQTLPGLEADTPDIEIVMIRGSSISGEVRDKVTGAILVNADIRLAGTGSSAQNSSAEKGRFHFSCLRPGRYQVLVMAGGYRHELPEKINLKEKEEKTLVILLSPLIRVSGVILSTRGRIPVMGARISIDSPHGGSRVHDQSINDDLDVTDENGRFCMTITSEGRHTIYALHDEFVSGSIAIEFSAGERRSGVEILLNDGARISGRVSDKSGNFLEGVCIWISSLGPHYAGGQKQTVSGADGKYAFNGLDVRSYRVKAVSIGARAITHEESPDVNVEVCTADGAKTVDLIVDLTPGVVLCKLFGRVLKDGVAVPGEAVLLKPGGGSSDSETRSDDAGRYEFIDVMPGEYEVEFGKIRKVVTIPSTALFEFDLVVFPGMISGQVTDKGTKKSIQWVSIHLYPSNGAGWSLRESTDAIGKFTFYGLEEGDYYVVADVYFSGYEISKRYETHVSSAGESEPLDIRLEKGAELEVACFDPLGLPAGGDCSLTVSWKDAYGETVGRGIQRPLEDGRIGCSGIPAGFVDVTLLFSEYAACSFRGKMIRKRGVNRLEARLSRGGCLKLHVTDEDGRPIAGAAASIFNADGSPAVFSTMSYYGFLFDCNGLRSNTDGNCEFPRIPAGEIIVKVRGGNAEAQSRKVSIEESKEIFLEFKLESSK